MVTTHSTYHRTSNSRTSLQRGLRGAWTQRFLGVDRKLVGIATREMDILIPKTSGVWTPVVSGTCEWIPIGLRTVVV